MNIEIQSILNLMNLAERLKTETRHSWLSNGRRESVAEHSWQMALLALLVHRHLEHPVDIERTLKMVVVHDLVEAEAGDIPFFETGPRKERKAETELRAIEHIRDMIDHQTGQEFYELFLEFEAAESPEAKLAKALDNLEVQIQHNNAELSTWEPVEYDLVYTKMDGPCAHDSFLKALCEGIKCQSEDKMIKNGIHPDSIKQRL